MLAQSQQQSSTDKKPNNVGQLVTIFDDDCYGIKAECFAPENVTRTIRYQHNVKLARHSVGIVVHTFYMGAVKMYVVCWCGKDLHGQLLVVASSRVKKV